MCFDKLTADQKAELDRATAAGSAAAAKPAPQPMTQADAETIGKAFATALDIHRAGAREDRRHHEGGRRLHLSRRRADERDVQVRTLLADARLDAGDKTGALADAKTAFAAEPDLIEARNSLLDLKAI